jgi:hypothetical protein
MQPLRVVKQLQDNQQPKVDNRVLRTVQRAPIEASG